MRVGVGHLFILRGCNTVKCATRVVNSVSVGHFGESKSSRGMEQYSAMGYVITLYETDGCIRDGGGPVVVVQLRG